MFKHKDKLYKPVQAGPWLAFEEVEAPEVANPCFRWLVGKMPLELVRQITSFFEWSYKETGGESVVHLFFNEDTDQWQATVLPQKGYTGMSVSLIADHPGRVEAVEALGAGFELAGTWHHHCAAAAFQSGTDRADEEDTFGLHVTVGGIGTARYSLHARCSFRKQFTPAVLSDWVALPASLEEMDLPPKVAEPLLLHLIAKPCADEPFPEGWKANVIKVAPPPVVQGRPWQPYFKGDDSTHGGYDWRSSIAEQDKKSSTRPATRTLDDDIRELCWMHSKEPLELAQMIEQDYRADPLLMDLAALMFEWNMDAADVVEELRDRHRAEQGLPQIE